ncbi:MAG: hypothetical protein IJE94_08755 [Oscillospiraceae bacterium]|nr:hypothetical protein [Oscillospiraceae bacterium]
MKRLICGLLALVMVLSLAACGKSPAPDTTPDDTPAPDAAPEYFVVGDGVYRNEKELDEKSIDRAIGKFQKFTADYCGEAERVFLALIPSKNGYLNGSNGHLNEAEFAILQSVYDKWESNFIDLSVCLDLEDYYRTDPHWRQERLGAVLRELGAALEFETDTVLDGDHVLSENWTEEVLTTEYIGVYGDEVDGVPAEEMTVLRHPDMNGYIVRNGETGEEMPLYDTEKLTGRDPYELFVGGPLSLVTIENPNAGNDRHLVVVRDSFGSALLPLLAQSYAKVTAVDIRYMMPNLVGNFVDFTDTDVLFLYSSTVLNNSITLK